jgi:hypothetical protein
MTQRLERKFSSWEEYEQELASNLKQYGIFLPGAFQLQMRERVKLDLYLPEGALPVYAMAEVVAVLPAGVALQIEDGAKVLENLAKTKLAIHSAPAISGMANAAPAETAEAPATEAGTEPEPEEPVKEDVSAEELAQEPDEKEVAEIENKVSSTGSDMSNMYAAVRKLPRMEKIKLAKRGNRKVLNILIQEGDRQLYRFIIQNPHLSAVEVLQLLKQPQLTVELLQELARNPAWAQNEEVKYQLVLHPKTPLPTALTLLNGLNKRQLGQIAKSQTMRHQLKSTALKLLLKRQSDAF